MAALVRISLLFAGTWTRSGCSDLACTHSRSIASLGAAFRDRSTAMPEFPSGAVAFLFTDIEGSTLL
jgi:hypothetical protein